MRGISSLSRLMLLMLLFLLLGASMSAAQEDAPPADIINEEGGAVVITGDVTYTNTLFTAGVAQPIIITEDQAGFVDRDQYFIMPPESQTLAQITSDFYESPFHYSLTLPIEPQGTYRDVDHDDLEEPGVQVFAIAYWSNTFGDPFLEERDLYGGGWSSAYASTRIDPDPSAEAEVIGGKYLIYSPDNAQSFPSGFGDDGLLFTDDDPIVTVPQGYTVVDMDTDPFTFDRSAQPEIDLIEGERSTLQDFSNLGYADAFDAMIELFKTQYAFTEYRNIDWDAWAATWRPRFEQAEADNDSLEYRRTLRDFLWQIPDGHVSAPFIQEDVVNAVIGGIGLSMRELDDGRFIATLVVPDGLAENAGIERGAEIVSIQGQPTKAWVDQTIATWFGNVGTDHYRRLEQLRFATRFSFGERVTVEYVNPGSSTTESARLIAEQELESLFVGEGDNLTGFELPVEYRLLPSGYGYVRIYSFSDNDLLTVQLWERMIQTLNEQGVPGLIIDMRVNGGGSGFLADQLAAYFFDDPLELGNTGFYDESLGDFYFDPRGVDRFYPPPENLRYYGDIAVIISPSCLSACEFFSYDMSIQDRAAIVGHYPTGGLGGSIQDFLMPENEVIRFTIGRVVNSAGEIHIEGRGVPPTLRVPVTEETLLDDEDALLSAAVDYLDDQR